MSQHIFRTTSAGAPVEVMLGYDPPLGHFFLNVLRGGEPLYSNLMDEGAFEHDLAYYRRKLDELGVRAPESIFTQVAIDQQLGNGDRRVLHEEDGSFSAL